MLSKSRRRWAAGLFLVFGLGVALAVSSCRSAIPRRDPTGEAFPHVIGEALDGQSVTLPDDRLGEPCLLLIGFVQGSQFDIDRWLLGLNQAGIEVPVLEVPTIKGLGARMASGFIDRGMRSGIPEEDWSSVVCVYGDAGPIVALTGNENPRPGRVVLLDATGRVAFFHDSGYSVSTLRKLEEALTRLRSES